MDGCTTSRRYLCILFKSKQTNRVPKKKFNYRHNNEVVMRVNKQSYGYETSFEQSFPKSQQRFIGRHY